MSSWWFQKFWLEKDLRCPLCSWGLPGDSDSKESACNAEDPSSFPGLWQLPGEKNDTPVEYSCWENTMDRGAWWVTFHVFTKSQTNWAINTFFFFFSAYLHSPPSPLPATPLPSSRFIGHCRHSVVSDSSWPYSQALCPWDFPGKNTRVGCHFFLQGNFLTQGWKLRLLHCRQILYHWAIREAWQVIDLTTFSLSITQLLCCFPLYQAYLSWSPLLL